MCESLHTGNMKPCAQLDRSVIDNRVYYLWIGVGTCVSRDLCNSINMQAALFRLCMAFTFRFSCGSTLDAVIIRIDNLLKLRFT